MTIRLTDRQQQILDLIRDVIRHTGYPPTRAEIAQALGFKSANAAEDHLKALARKGMIELTAGASRGIRLVSPNQDPVADEHADTAQTPSRDTSVHSSNVPSPSALPGAGQWLLPLIGRVAAGHPVLAAENIEKELAIDPAMFGQRPDYLLKVKGLSMKEAGILDGDLLAIRKTSDARHGQIVVARIDDEVTVKRLDKNTKEIRLLPENPDFEPITIKPGQEFTIEGIALGLIRTTTLH
jgi:repressor LexA